MLKDKFHTMIATGFWVGKIPFAPGTFGSLLAVILWVIINHFFAVAYQENFPLTINILMWLGLIIFSFAIGVWSSGYYCQKHNNPLM